MRGTLHTAQKSLIDTCEKHADLKVSDYIKMSKVSRGRGRYSEFPIVELAADISLQSNHTG
jgi:hypothetical protein